MSDRRPMPIASQLRRHWVAIAALSVLLLTAAGAFTYSRLTAGIGHHRGDTITHAMPGGGSVAFTLESVAVSAPEPSNQSDATTSYTVRIQVRNTMSSALNMNAAQFQAQLEHSLPPPAEPLFYPQPDAHHGCDQEVASGANMECTMTFT